MKNISKKYLVILYGILSLTFFVSAESFAKNSDVVSIQAATQQTDGSYATLKGKIIKKLNGNLYLFQDKTGQLTVEIGDAQKNNATFILPKDVTIMGKVDKNKDETRVVVSQLSSEQINLQED